MGTDGNLVQEYTRYTIMLTEGHTANSGQSKTCVMNYLHLRGEQMHNGSIQKCQKSCNERIKGMTGNYNLTLPETPLHDNFCLSLPGIL